MPSEDKHFLIDNVAPIEAAYVLRILDPQVGLTTEEIRARLFTQWGYTAQKALNFTTRRLLDLHLSVVRRGRGRGPEHTLSSRGIHVKQLLEFDPCLHREIMHFLHYDGWVGHPASRKLFWSYRQCCNHVWQKGQFSTARTLAAEVQSRIALEFPELYAKRRGGNFNPGGVSSGWRPWVAQLQPCPIGTAGELVPRDVDYFQLPLLALDNVYRVRGYRYGDPVLMDDMLLDAIAAVFFLEPTCCHELLERGGRLERSITLRSTFAGTSVTLTEPYTIERL